MQVDSMRIRRFFRELWTSRSRRKALGRWGFYYARTAFGSPRILDVWWAFFWFVVVGLFVGYVRQGDDPGAEWASLSAARSAERMAQTLEQSRRSVLEILEESTGRGGIPGRRLVGSGDADGGGTGDAQTGPELFRRLREKLPPFATDWGPLVLFLFGLSIGLRRWQVAREDAAMDQYFERRHVINALLLMPEAGRARKLVGAAVSESGRIDHDERFFAKMFVFAELDQLEHVFEKYRLRLIPNYIAYRACQVMISRNWEESFASSVLELLESGRYTSEFKSVVVKLVEEARGERREEGDDSAT